MIDERVAEAARDKEKQYEVVVNGQPFTVTTREVTFAQVVGLAFGAEADDPNKTFTITYRKSANHKHDGTMVEGSSVKVKDGTIFNVTSTTKS